MAVRARDRRGDPLKVMRLCDELTAYTLRILAKEDRFPRRTRWMFGGPMCDLAQSFHSNMHNANNIKVESVEDARERHKCQTLALAALKTLDDKMELAIDVLELNCDDLEHWGNLYNAEVALLQGWLGKDTKRFTDKFR